ncbi:Protein of unknown function [Austwickia chelonae]|uniref:ATP-binding protein n=1 Tax=Austwickia chelonae NBRC 105200 TaxID=1184607 RepID=K6UMP1_9MICO|nr:DUF3107 domain-containing protein [Austwickia chelonae]GAB78281.1 hypothetical protein AUCHE_08_05270 [Austwickia chelonae NBRC 105200]SEW00362.1 Protein of unknown function [Austwickia chelonae]
MEIRIGVQHCSREVAFESDMTPEEVEAQVVKATGTGTVLRLLDTKGGVVVVPGSNIGYVEIGAPRKAGVGFGKI